MQDLFVRLTNLANQRETLDDSNLLVDVPNVDLTDDDNDAAVIDAEEDDPIAGKISCLQIKVNCLFSFLFTIAIAIIISHSHDHNHYH
jgi:hypothetical protein